MRNILLLLIMYGEVQLRGKFLNCYFEVIESLIVFFRIEYKV